MSAQNKLAATLDPVFRSSEPGFGMLQCAMARISEQLETMTLRTLFKAAGFAAASGMVLAILPALWLPVSPQAMPDPKPVAPGPTTTEENIAKPVTACADVPESPTVPADVQGPTVMHADVPMPQVARPISPKPLRRVAEPTRPSAPVRNWTIPQQVAVVQKPVVFTPRATVSRLHPGLPRFAAQPKAAIEVQRAADPPLSISALSLTAMELPTEAREREKHVEQPRSSLVTRVRGLASACARHTIVRRKAAQAQ